MPDRRSEASNDAVFITVASALPPQAPYPDWPGWWALSEITPSGSAFLVTWRWNLFRPFSPVEASP